ncbi:hypothetical protein ES702_06519 [subsurface metagenome]
MYSAWVACDFRKQDRKEVIDFFENIFKMADLKYEILDEPQLKRLTEKQKQALLKHPIFIAILTKRYKVAGIKDYKPTEPVLVELGMALGQNKVIGAFVEEGIERIDYVYEAVEGDFVKFNRLKLLEVMPNVLEYAQKLQEKQTLRETRRISKELPIPTVNYRFKRVQKNVTIFSNGHGIIEFTCKAEVYSENFKNIIHSFSLDKGTPKGTKLQPFTDLKRRKKSDRFSDQAFFYKLLTPSPRFSMGFGGVEVDTEESKKFRFTFTGDLPIHQEIEYAWGWSCPNLFPLGPGDCRGGPDTLPRTSITVSNLVEELILQVTFEDNYPIYGSPFLKATDESHNTVTLKSPRYERILNSIGTTYRFTQHPTENLISIHYLVQWRLSQ